MSMHNVALSGGTTVASGGAGSGSGARLRSAPSGAPDVPAFMNALSEAARRNLAERAKRRAQASHAGANNSPTQSTNSQSLDDAPAASEASRVSRSAVGTGDGQSTGEADVSDLPDQTSDQNSNPEETIDEVTQSQVASVAATPLPVAQMKQVQDGEPPLTSGEKDINTLAVKGEAGAVFVGCADQNQGDDSQNQGKAPNQPQTRASSESQVNTPASHPAFQASEKPKHSKPAAESDAQSSESADATLDPNAHHLSPTPAAPAASETPQLLPLKTNAAVSQDTPAASTTEMPANLTAPPSIAALSDIADVAPAAQESPVAHAPDPMDQVVLGLKSKLDARTGKAEIRLDPPNLGAVKISLTLNSGALTAQFESASEMVRDLLKSHLDKLKTVLESQGVSVDRLAVEAPADTQSQGQGSAFGSATHDGRSAGKFFQDPRSSRNSQDADGFASLFRQAQEAPLDLVA